MLEALDTVYVFVSTGRFRSFEEMRAYIDQTYTEDGDGVPSAFMRQVGLSEYEPGCIEALLSKSAGPVSLSELLADASYSDQWLPQLDLSRLADAAICVFPPIVVDFVDNATRYNQPLTLHRVVHEKLYRPGGLVLAPDALRQAESEAMARGEKPPAILEIGLWARDYQEIDLFNWQEARPDLLTVSDMERELAVAEDFVRRAIERGHIIPDHSFPIGERTYHDFKRDSIAAVRAALGIPEVGDDNIKDLFTQYVAGSSQGAAP